MGVSYGCFAGYRFGGVGIGSVQNRNVQGTGQQAFMLGQFGYAWTEDSLRFDSTEPIGDLQQHILHLELRFRSVVFDLRVSFKRLFNNPTTVLYNLDWGWGFGLAPTNTVNMLIKNIE